MERERERLTDIYLHIHYHTRSPYVHLISCKKLSENVYNVALSLGEICQNTCMSRAASEA